MPSLFSARSFACAIGVSSAFMLPSAPYAAEMPLTLAEAQRLAVARSLQPAARELAAAASRDMAVAAAQLPDPVFKAGIDNLPVSGAERFSLGSDFMTMRRVGVMQELTRADKRQLRAERFERDAQKALAEKDQAIAALERDTALAWLDLYYAQAAAALAAEQTAQTGREIEAAQGAYRAGRGTQAELLAARSALAMAEDRVSDIARRSRNAATMLARWIGDAAAAPLAGKPDTGTLRLDPATLAHHPSVAVFARQEEVAATEVKLARANQKADWSVEVAYQQRGASYPNMVSVGVSVPLQWDRPHRQDRELAAKLALADQARAEREDQFRAHLAETRAMLDEWQTNRQRQARYQGELIPLARERTSAVLAAYRGGKASLADQLAAQRNETELRLQALQLEADTDRLWARLNFLFPTAQGAAFVEKSAQ
ncbi:MAG: Heavy metal efflux outer membrane protein [Massilia sp.]|nr:Heavy metal efflux outer membrane protein [Massilia sp.]